MTTRSRATRRSRSWCSTPCWPARAAKRWTSSPLIRAARNTLRSNELDPAFKAEAILLPQEAVDCRAHRSRRSRTPSTPPASNCGRALGTRARGRSGQGAVGGRRRGRRSVAAGEGRPGGSARSRLDCSPAGDPERGRADRQGAIRRSRQHDRPSGSARGARVARRARTRGGAAGLLRSLRERRRWSSTNGSGLQAAAQRDGHRWTRSSGSRSIPPSRCSNPNRLRSLASSFAMNHWVFNDASGRGYRFLADMIIAVGQTQPADCGAACAAARALAPARAEALGTDARSSWSGSSTRAACRRTSTSRRAKSLG